MSKSNPPSHLRLVTPLLRVLLVDDDPSVVRALRRALMAKRPDWQITTEASAADAMASLETDPTDVVVSDYEMPDVDGLEMFRRIKRQHPTVLRVIVSGKPRETAGVIAPGLLHAWLPKTNTAEGLAIKLEELLSRRGRAKRRPKTG